VLQNDKLPAGQDVTLDQYSQATLRSLKDAMPDLEIQAEREITIGGMAGRAIVYELESEGATFRVWKAWTVVGADAYVFTYNAPVELYDQFAADVAEMIDSFGAGTAAQKAESWQRQIRWRRTPALLLDLIGDQGYPIGAGKWGFQTGGFGRRLLAALIPLKTGGKLPSCP